MDDRKIRIKRLYPDSQMPIRGTEGAGGLDLFAYEDVNIPPGTSRLVPVGVAMAIPRDWVGFIKDRSNVAKKNLVAEAGVIDSDYRGEVKALMYNQSKINYEVRKGDRITQIVFLHYTVDFMEVEDLDVTERGENGFGYTGR